MHELLAIILPLVGNLLQIIGDDFNSLAQILPDNDFVLVAIIELLVVRRSCIIVTQYVVHIGEAQLGILHDRTLLEEPDVLVQQLVQILIPVESLLFVVKLLLHIPDQMREFTILREEVNLEEM